MEFTSNDRYEESKTLDTIKNNISIESNLYFDINRNHSYDSRYQYDTVTGEIFIADERGIFKNGKSIDNTYKFSEFIQKEIIDKIPTRYKNYIDDKIRNYKQHKEVEEKIIKKEQELEEYKIKQEDIRKENSKKELEFQTNLKSFKYLCYVSIFTLISVIILKFVL